MYYLSGNSISSCFTPLVLIDHDSHEYIFNLPSKVHHSPASPRADPYSLGLPIVVFWLNSSRSSLVCSSNFCSFLLFHEAIARTESMSNGFYCQKEASHWRVGHEWKFATLFPYGSVTRFCDFSTDCISPRSNIRITLASNETYLTYGHYLTHPPRYTFTSDHHPLRGRKKGMAASFE